MDRVSDATSGYGCRRRGHWSEPGSCGDRRSCDQSVRYLDGSHHCIGGCGGRGLRTWTIAPSPYSAWWCHWLYHLPDLCQWLEPRQTHRLYQLGEGCLDWLTKLYGSKLPSRR